MIHHYRKVRGSKVVVFFASALLLLLLTSCYQTRVYRYYQNKNVFVKTNGTVTFMQYSYDKEALLLGFDQLDQWFSYSGGAFKITGDNLDIVQKKGIDEKISIGDQVSFMSSQEYFYDGYTMPIVEIEVNGEELLSFDEGYANLLEWQKKQLWQDLFYPL